MALAPSRAERVYPLDAIRGLLAIGVMCYHVVPGTPEVFGTYGVYMFFVLSGFALAHVYGSRVDVQRFAVARIARLAPLWIPVVMISATRFPPEPLRLLLNLTGLFGFVQPGATSMVVGGWSIGIEVVFYVFFPVLVLFATRWLVVLTAAALAFRLVYVNAIWPPGATLADVWVAYTVAPVFIVFFLAGMTWSRFGMPGREWSGRPAKAATVLGDLSYGTYLLHPIVFVVTGSMLTLVVTPILALLIHPDL